MEDSLQKQISSEERSKRIFELIPNPIYIWKQVKNDLILIDYNKAAEEITEGKIKDLVGVKAKEFHKEQPEILEDLNRCIKCKVKISRELKYTFKTTGKEKILNVVYNFIPPEIVLVYTGDITDKRKSEEKYRFFFQNFLGIAYQGTLDFVPIFFHGAVKEITGYTEEEFQSGNPRWNEIIHHEDLVKIVEEDKDIIRKVPNYSKEREYRIIRKDGNLRWVFEIIQNLSDENGKPYMVQGEIYDITRRKKAELKLRDSEKRFKYLIASNPAIIYTAEVSGDYGATFISDNVEDKWGYKTEDFTKDSDFWLNHVHPDDRKYVLEVLLEIHEKEHFIYDYRFKLKNGTYQWMRDEAILLKDNNGNHIEMIGSVIDITGRKKAEQKLRESEKKYRLLIEDTIVGVWVIDLEGNTTLVNPRMAEILGYKVNEMVGKHLFSFMDEESKKLAIQNLEKQKREGINIEAEFKFHHKNGNPVYTQLRATPIFNDDGVFDGAFAFIADTTERKKAEEKLKDSEEKYRELYENAPVAYYSIGTDKSIIRCNNASLRLLGYPREDLLNMKVFDLYPDTLMGLPKAKALFQNFLGGEKIQNEVLQMKKKNGDLIWISLTVNSVLDPVGNVIESRSIVVDITERKRAEQVLRESEEKYREAYNRSNLYKDIFTHDINNMLQNILSSIGLSKLYSDDPSKKEKFDEVTDIINEQVIRCNQLVSNVQKISEVEEVRSIISPIEPSNLLNKAIKLVRSNFHHRNINIEIKSFQNEYLVNANELLINLFQNILFNAVKHNVNEIIEILIRISKISKDGAKFIKFEFLDNGIGIHDSMKKEIFTRDYKEYKKDKIPSGIGLGLLLVKRIVDSYSGDIKVENKIKGDYSKGSNFIILIPEAV